MYRFISRILNIYIRLIYIFPVEFIPSRARAHFSIEERHNSWILTVFFFNFSIILYYMNQNYAAENQINIDVIIMSFTIFMWIIYLLLIIVIFVSML